MAPLAACSLALLLFLTAAGSACAAVLYVDVRSTNATPPFTNWSTAAATIQDAVDAAAAGDDIVVTNGVYPTGGRAVYGTMTNRVAVYKPLALLSVNGPQFTIIQGAKAAGGGSGDGAIRCVYLTNGAALSGFTLTNGATRDWRGDQAREQSGGGLWCESASALVSNCVVAGNSADDEAGGAYSGTLNNCTLSGNFAPCGAGAYQSALNNCMLRGNSALYGGGAYQSTLNNCTVGGNSATGGGGAHGCMLNNCTVTGNSADMYGGGALGGTLNNCIIYYNTAWWEDAKPLANYGDSALNYCCTTPMPTNGLGNITSAPLFVDRAGWNLRLQSNSPGINAGNNAYVTNSTDLDGRPRIVGGTVDIGAYEFQPGVSGLFIGWLQQYGLPTDGSADATDPDADGLNNWQEWRCATDPTNALSVLRLLAASPAGTNVTVTWQSVAGVSYFLERSTDLSATPPFTPLATNLLGQTGTNTFTDTNTVALPRLFYRVGVGN